MKYSYRDIQFRKFSLKKKVSRYKHSRRLKWVLKRPNVSRKHYTLDIALLIKPGPGLDDLLGKQAGLSLLGMIIFFFVILFFAATCL